MIVIKFDWKDYMQLQYYTQDIIRRPNVVTQTSFSQPEC